jgi:hypothetical protein
MAGMAGGDQGIAEQWIEEGVNSAGQVASAGASVLLYARTYKARISRKNCPV